jgi:hypothetical protein
MFPDFLIIQRYQRSTPIIAKCENDREQGTATRSFWETIGDEEDSAVSAVRRQRKKAVAGGSLYRDKK